MRIEYWQFYVWLVLFVIGHISSVLLAVHFKDGRWLGVMLIAPIIGLEWLRFSIREKKDK